jgi:cysteine desulfurase family protein
MIYFDNAASGGRKPDNVISAVLSSLKVCANPGRSAHKAALACATVVDSCRKQLDRFFDGYGFERIAFTKNCTEALNLALFGVLHKGDHVVTTCMEHNSVLRPLEKMKRDGRITYDVCSLSSSDERGNITPEKIKSLIKPNTRLVAITSASNVNGAIPPIAEIKKVLPKHTLLLCDGAQGGGHFPLKMRETGIDLLSLAGHKGMMGIQGSGALLFSDRVDPEPFFYGGTGSMSLSLAMPDFYPDALESGTLSFPAIVSLLEGIRFLTEHGDEITKRLYTLTEYLLSKIQTLDFYSAYSIPNPCGIVALRHKYLQSEFVASALSNRFDIAVRSGLHCAPLMHEALGTLDDGLIRVSFSHFNSLSEIDALTNALSEIEHA